ncbi:uncharacterized protein EDB93DRAFT_1100824 [Suillus bovinus]|uniref:uncharacterized protein n=1 Tax=Suillus bovinus TaxID=48563 RepID=UPI001B875B8A|nr:uncharacterized protein EDB93DRAFT_1100824 [Suillus bovinus]KAG2158040.1 hypothetical protein EDB93DRAFT_1100824 [Suillus bovinus]
MNGSSTSAIEISLWRTWALTVTHEACEYTAQKFNAEKTGGDPVIPSPNLDTDLVMACDRLKEIWAATDLLSPSLERSVKVDGNWRTNPEWFKHHLEDVGLPAGCINLSPAWFQQGHENLADPEVSASLKGPLSEGILNAIARPAAIASAALRIMHPEQYWAGLQTFSSLGEKAESKELPRMSKILEYWASVFNTLSIISNLEFGYNPGCMIGFSGRIVRHGVHEMEGDRVGWACYKRPALGWSSTDNIIDLTLGNAKKNGLLQKEPTSQKGTEKQRNTQILSTVIKARSSVTRSQHLGLDIWTSVVKCRESGIGNGDLELKVRYSAVNIQYSMLGPQNSIFGAQ